MDLRAVDAYRNRGLSERALEQLSGYGDLLIAAEHNVTGLKDAARIEPHHFLDSLTLLDLSVVREARTLVDVGSGGGVPAVVLAIALPSLCVEAVESASKKCAFIERAADALGLGNLVVTCARAEEYGRSTARESFDVAVVRAVGSLALDAEFAVPLVRVGGAFVAMKGAVSDQERIAGAKAVAILGVGPLQRHRVDPFPEARDRWLYWGYKTASTPPGYPRRVGIPAKRPLG